MIVNDDGTNTLSLLKRIQRDLAISDDATGFLMVVDIYNHSKLNIYKIGEGKPLLLYEVRGLHFKDLADIISTFEGEEKIEIITGRLENE